MGEYVIGRGEVRDVAAGRTAPAPRALGALVAEIRIEHEAAARDARAALEHAIRAGELLIAAKGQLRHGDWLPWLERFFPASARTAQVYMRLAKRAEPAYFDSIDSALKALAEPSGQELTEPAALPEPRGTGRAPEQRAAPPEPELDDPEREAEVVTGQVVEEQPERAAPVEPASGRCPRCGQPVRRESPPA